MSSTPPLTYVDWFNNRRLHGEITGDASYTTPAEHEANFRAEANKRATLNGAQSPATQPTGMVGAATSTPTDGADTQ